MRLRREKEGSKKDSRLPNDCIAFVNRATFQLNDIHAEYVFQTWILFSKGVLISPIQENLNFQETVCRDSLK